MANHLCGQALQEPEIVGVSRILDEAGYSLTTALQALDNAADQQRLCPSLISMRSLIDPTKIKVLRFPLERKLLLERALVAIDKVSKLPVDESVKQLFCKEFIFIAQPTEEALPRFSMDLYPFFAYAKVACLKRFCAGHYHWEVSGFPRSWLSKIPLRLLPPTLRFLCFETRGLKPWFVSHMRGTGPGTPFLVESEFRKSFYRMALAIEKQPEIRALMAQSWLHSPETHRVSPHLAFLNKIFLEAGGIVTDLGLAGPEDGFAIGNKQRAELYRSGHYKPTNGVAACSREQAIAWAQQNKHLQWQLEAK
jgi:hypothetical protein